MRGEEGVLVPFNNRVIHEQSEEKDSWWSIEWIIDFFSFAYSFLLFLLIIVIDDIIITIIMIIIIITILILHVAAWRSQCPSTELPVLHPWWHFYRLFGSCYIHLLCDWVSDFFMASRSNDRAHLSCSGPTGCDDTISSLTLLRNVLNQFASGTRWFMYRCYCL